MRFVKRKKFVCVMLIAIVFGAALPYLECPFMTFARNWMPIGVPGRNEVYKRWSHYEHSLSIKTAGEPSPADMKFFQAACHNALPDGAAKKLGSGQTVNVRAFGWPFCAIYMCEWSTSDPSVFDRDGTAITGPGWRWLSPEFRWSIPIGVIWTGLLGNIGVSAFTAAVLYWIATFATARWLRRKPGQCWKCGYLRGEAAVCPECGSAPSGL